MRFTILTRPACVTALIGLVCIGVAIAQSQPGQTQSGQNQPGQSQPGQIQSGQLQPGQSQANQNPHQSSDLPGRQSQQSSAQSGGSSHNDSQLASCLLVDNQNEIALAEFAQQRSQSNEVKQFAQQMVQDHKQMVSKLQQISGVQDYRPETTSTGQSSSQQTAQHSQSQSGASSQSSQGAASQGITTQGAASQIGQAGRDQTSPRTSTTIAGAGGGETIGQAGSQSQQGARIAGYAPNESSSGQLDLVRLKHELGQKCLQSAQRELSQKNGAEFDRCFVGMQVAKHMEALDTLEVFQNHASSELRSAISEAIPTVQRHLEHAKQMEKTLQQTASNR